MSAAAPRGLRAGTTGPVSGRFRFPPVPGGPFRSSAGSSGPRTGYGLSIPSDPELARSGLPETASREGLDLLAPGAPGPAGSDGSHRARRVPRRTGSAVRSSPAARGASGTSGWALGASRTRRCGCCSCSCSSCYRLDLAAGVSRA